MQALLTHSLRGQLGSPWLEIVIAVTATLCGLIVGVERERREKPAGLRTLVLVCLGSAAFTVASYAFTSSNGDPGRVAAQIVTGIGFLGAGAILHGSGFISGMTTAATIWVTAAIGMLAGAGHVAGALALAIFVSLVHTGIYFWENRHLRSMPASTVRFVMDPARGKTRIRVEKLMEDYHVHEATFGPANSTDDHIQGSVTFILPQRHRRDFLQELASIPEVLEIIPQEAEASRPRFADAKPHVLG
jgi:putative Mg2+ transporter-C (MgtC) family protein